MVENFKELLEAGVHLGHIKRRWNPKMAEYIFMERNGIHILDLNKTAKKIEEVEKATQHLARTGRKILFIGTKKQARNIIKEHAEKVGMPYVTERWLGGMLTNFVTVRKLIKKMLNIEKFTREPSYQHLSKKEKQMVQRNHNNLENLLGGISNLTRLPIAVFIVDVKKEHTAFAEALKLNIPVFGIVDTNADPTFVDYPIPANDESTKSINLIIKKIADAIQTGLDERNKDKEDRDQNMNKESGVKEAKNTDKAPETKKRTRRVRVTEDKKQVDEPKKGEKEAKIVEGKKKIDEPKKRRKKQRQSETSKK